MSKKSQSFSGVSDNKLDSQEHSIKTPITQDKPEPKAAGPSTAPIVPATPAITAAEPVPKPQIIAPDKPADPPIDTNNAGQNGEQHGRKANMVVLVLALIMVIVGAVILAGHGNKSGSGTKNGTKTVAKSVCSTAILQQAASNLEAFQVQGLQPIVDQIQTLSGYQQDPNCMYVITTYYINVSDATNARKNFTVLQQAYAHNPHFNSMFQTNSKTVATLDKTISDLQVDQMSLEHNAYGVDEQGQVVRADGKP